MINLRSILAQNSIEAIPERYRAEFWQEMTFVNIRRVRSLLVFAAVACAMLVYVINVRNMLNLSEDDNRIVLWMHLFLFGLSSVFAVVVFVRPLHSPQDVALYHKRVMQFFTIGVTVGPQALIYAIIVTKGHPVFFFAAVIIWYSSLRIEPRVLTMVLLLLLAGLWAQLIIFSPPFGDAQFRGAAYITSIGITIALILSGSFLFRSAVENFRQRKAVEEERNRVAELNTELSAAYLEAETLNQELQHRQEILEHQATEIEIINTQLQEQNEILTTLDEEKNELLNIVSHDLKNPISAVLGLAEMLQSDAVLNTEQSSAITGQIVLAAHQMLALVKNLLDINRLESGGIQFSFEKCHIAALVESAVQQYTPLAAAKDIRIHYMPEDASNMVFADRQAVVQILDNLISNAVKYSPYGKQVFLRVLSTTQLVRVEVQDEGEGISEEDMTKLFGKFTRLSARPTGGEHSTGLGLSIVKKMVEAMRGRVWCESVSGQGATFIVELPTER
jgi:signal transduction histidine kinase